METHPSSVQRSNENIIVDLSILQLYEQSMKFFSGWLRQFSREMASIPQVTAVGVINISDDDVILSQRNADGNLEARLSL